MHKYLKLANKLTPAGCQEIIEDGQTFIVSERELNLALLFLFDLEPVDKSGLNENDRLALDGWYEGKEVKKWWRESTYEEKLLSKSPMEIEEELYGEW